MIVREMPNGQLLCIHQTSHALMAEEFCRHWGNRDFARPQPYTAVMLGIAQHDNGWYEWELAPQLRNDGYPMDFMHGPLASVKLDLWRCGVHRAYAQHPYAALLVGRHATLLYQGDLHRMPEQEREQTLAFVTEQDALLARVRRNMGEQPEWQAALREQAVLANTRLLQFGDSASLQVCVPWANRSTLPNCPVDGAATYTTVEIWYDESTITFDPWPFGVEQFAVQIHGWLLPKRHFDDEADYHAALDAASYHCLTWRVTKA
jgi:hypothetical protein